MRAVMTAFELSAGWAAGPARWAGEQPASRTTRPTRMPEGPQGFLRRSPAHVC